MKRELPEWIGKTPSAAIPPRVQLRIYGDGMCRKCGRPLAPGKWEIDHVVALVNGGAHRESNLQALCASPCHSEKTAADVAEKSEVYAKAAAHAGIKRKPKGRPMAGTKASGWRKRMDGTVERRARS